MGAGLSYILSYVTHQLLCPQESLPVYKWRHYHLPCLPHGLLLRTLGSTAHKGLQGQHKVPT